MPVYIMVALLALLIALIAYSIGSISAFRSKTVTRRTLTFLWVGIVCDVAATAMMAISAGGLDLSPSGLPHTVVALVAFFAMLGFAIAATVAKSGDAIKGTVARWILAPWALWVGVFVWGMIVRGSARMGG